MPKMKTNRSVAKRFRKTGTGKVRKPRSFRSHLLTGRSRKRKRNNRRLDVLSKADEKRIKVMLPY